MTGYLNTAAATLAAWADQFTPAQWVLVGLIALLVFMLIIAAFEDCWNALEKAFQGHGVGRDEMADIHERTWPEYWQ